MSLTWRLRRLQAMSAGEVMHRATIALRDKVYTPKWARWSAEEAARNLITDSDCSSARSRIAALSLPIRQCPSLVGTLREGQSLLKGRWSLFGREVQLSDPPNWRANPMTGQEWPDDPADRIQYRRADIAGGAKYAWELGRLTFLHTLAVCYALTEEPAYATRVESWLLDFCRRNPIGHGIHHASGIEQAVRNITILHALSVLLRARWDVSRETLDAALGLCMQQALHLRGHLSIGSSGNNHLVAELSGLVVVASCLAGGGGRRSGTWERLLEFAWRGLGDAIPAQFHPDGTPAEQAFRYLPFLWELALVGLSAGEKRGLEPPPAAVERLSKSLEFARAVRLPGGELPPLGDEDDGRVLLPAEGSSRLDLVGNALAVWLGAPRVSATAHCWASLLRDASDSDVLSAADGRLVFADGGYTAWRRGDVLLLWDHGPLGFRSIAAHGHADALSVVLYVGDIPVIADPGTFAYHEDVASRDRFRSTPWHSTVNFGRRDQSENLGPFLWGAKAEVTKEGEGFEVRWHSGERHWRSVSFEDGEVVIEDRVAGDDAEVVFVLGPEVEVSLSDFEATLSLGERRVVLRAEGFQPWRVEEGEFSPRFGQRVPTKRLCARFGDISGTTRLVL